MSTGTGVTPGIADRAFFVALYARTFTHEVADVPKIVPGNPYSSCQGIPDRPCAFRHRGIELVGDPI
jgi:hypothetical protein